MVDARDLADPLESPAQPPGRRPRIAYLSFSSAEFDARTFRMARSAMDAGFEVVVYARWHRQTAAVEERDGYRIVRVPFNWKLAVPGLRRRELRRARASMAAMAAEQALAASTGATTTGDDAPVDVPRPPLTTRLRNLPRRIVRRALRPIRRWHWVERLKDWPLRPMGWAIALEDVVEPADIWHGMWAGSLPALGRMRRRHGGRTIYDSRDVFMRSRTVRPPRSARSEILEWRRAALGARPSTWC